jgi:heat shock protein HslJ
MTIRPARLWAVLLAAGLLAAGCGAPEDRQPAEQPAAEAANPLADTEWKLVEIQSMSDEVETVYPDDPSLYTLRFAADGTASLRLDCNQGTGSWSAKLSSPGRGKLEFGPIAATAAMCPPRLPPPASADYLGDRITRDLGYVRSFTIEGGRLHLSLMADGGIYVWEPLPAPAAGRP